MKKQLITFFAIAALSMGVATQASAHSYTVKSGDTLYSISRSENVSVDSIKSLNNLSTNLIKVNQTLKITEDDANKTQYTVQKGDTLYSISRDNGISVNEIKNLNGLTQTTIYVGQVLNVSTAVSPAASVKEFQVSATAYTASCLGCSGITKTGINLLQNPHLKVIAVDPTVIPLGSKVWVEGYGDAIAGDVGSAIKGNKIDVFLPNYSDAIKWGRKTVNVKVYQ